MAKPKSKRRRKHRGTQGGSIDRRGRTSRPKSRAEARQQLRAAREQKGMQPPTWRGAVTRGVIAAIMFAAILLILGQRTSAALTLALFMLVFYIPMGYFMDRFFYRRRIRAMQRGE